MMRVRLMMTALFLSLIALPAIAHDPDLHNLPLGDGKLSVGPRVGYVWACRLDPHAGGAMRDGPWIDTLKGTFDITRKTMVTGQATWAPHFAMQLRGDSRIFSTNDLPPHPTGVFPIRRSDPAFQYDPNPNAITAQTMTVSLPANPTLGSQPQCAPGAVGILLTGVVLFSALDGPGRDAVAHEVQDGCHGHPQPGGVYHYHSLTPCLEDKRLPDGHSALVGYALDGFGIFGQFDAGGRALSSSDLDECHGHTHVIPWDGKRVVMYHYHATNDYPYSVGCMRGAVQRENLRTLSGPPPSWWGAGPPGPPGGPPPFRHQGP